MTMVIMNLLANVKKVYENVIINKQTYNDDMTVQVSSSIFHYIIITHCITACLTTSLFIAFICLKCPKPTSTNPL